MTIPAVAIPSSSSPPKLYLNQLQTLKHSIIGHSLRKQRFLQEQQRFIENELIGGLDGSISRLVLLRERIDTQDDDEEKEEMYKVGLELTALIGCISMPNIEACTTLLSLGVDRVLIRLFQELSSDFPWRESRRETFDGKPTMTATTTTGTPTTTTMIKLMKSWIETTLRSIKIVYEHLDKVRTGSGGEGSGWSFGYDVLDKDESQRSRGVTRRDADNGPQSAKNASQLLRTDPPLARSTRRFAKRLRPDSGAELEMDVDETHSESDDDCDTLVFESADLRAGFDELVTCSLGYLYATNENDDDEFTPLTYLTDILEEVVFCKTRKQNDSGTKTRLAELVCSLLTSTLPLLASTLPSLASKLPTPASIGRLHLTTIAVALCSLVCVAKGALQERAILALTTVLKEGELVYGQNTLKYCAPKKREAAAAVLADLAQSGTPSLQLAATMARIVLMRQVHSETRGGSDNETACIPTLLRLIEHERELRIRATFTLTYLIAQNPEAQKVCVSMKALDIFKSILEQPLPLEQPYLTSSAIEESSQTTESALLCIAAICSTIEAHRHCVLDAKLLTYIVHGLKHRSAGVRGASCHCLRGLSRSVNVLRTSLVDAHASEPLIYLLREDEETFVKVLAVSTLSNLMLEFSPTRDVLIAKGCIPMIVELTKGNDDVLLTNALWALKNASYQSTASFKKDLMNSLTWSHLATLIDSSSAEISIQALGILRNLTCTSGPSPITGLLPSEMGETKLLDLLSQCLTENEREIVLQALYCLVNLATADEGAKLAIVARSGLLRTVIGHLSSNDSETRCAAVWIIINLAHVSASPTTSTTTNGSSSSNLKAGRRPLEIVQKLRAMGVEDRLRRMTDDESLDVRERVRDALDGFQGML